MLSLPTVWITTRDACGTEKAPHTVFVISPPKVGSPVSTVALMFARLKVATCATEVDEGGAGVAFAEPIGTTGVSVACLIARGEE